MLIHQRRTLGKMGVIHTSNIDEVKRSTSENISVNTNQNNPVVAGNRNVPFEIKRNAKIINFARLQSSSPSAAKTDEDKNDMIKHDTIKKDMIIKNKVMEEETFNKRTMILPFSPLKTNDTDVFIDSEPNSPKKYNYDLIKPLIEKTIRNLELVKSKVVAKSGEVVAKSGEVVAKSGDELMAKSGDEVMAKSDDEVMAKSGDEVMAKSGEVVVTNMTDNNNNNNSTGVVSEEKIKPLVEKYMRQFIEEEDPSHHYDYEDIPDCATTTFEGLIEPAVARIVQRIIKYDYSHEKMSFMNDDNVSLNLNVDYDEVYDYEYQEKGQFEKKTPPPEPPEPPEPPGMYNPMYDTTTSSTAIQNNNSVNIADVYNTNHCLENAKNYMRFKPQSRLWIPFGNGIDKGNITDIAIDRIHEKMYIVGHFKHVNRTPIENVAVYDKKQRTWGNVGNGVPNIATCVAVHEKLQILFVGGLYTKVGKGSGQISAQNIAAYYILENKWVQLGEGLNRECNTIILDENNGKLYAGGTFTKSGEQALNYIGVYDLNTGLWSSLSGGEINGPCRTLLKINDQLYIGGIFTHVGHDDDIHASYVAKYDLEQNTWSDLCGGLQGYCNALAYDPTENVIYVGGTFISVGYRENSQEAHHVAKYNIGTQSWGTMLGGLNNVVNDLTYDPDEQCLYVGGKFTHTFEDNMLVNRICKFDKKQQKWLSLTNSIVKHLNDEENDNVGFNGPCNIIKKDSNSVVIAGSFQIAGSITANSIVRYLRDNNNKDIQ